MEPEVPHLDIELSKEDLRSGIDAIVSLLRPDWNSEDYEIEDRSNGYMNLNYAVTVPGKEDGIFVRIVNSRIDGQLERATNAMSYLLTQKLGAQMLMTFRNGLVMEFLEGEVVTWETIEKVKEPKVWLSIAREMARYHTATNWEMIKKYEIPKMSELGAKHHKMLMDVYYSGKVPEELLKGLPTPEELLKLKNAICEDLDSLNAEVRFCHVDSNPTNLLIQENGDTIFVDYDECIVHYTCVEISRFFALLGGILECNFDTLPTPEEEDVFIREYLRYMSVLEPERGEVTEKSVEFWKFLVRRSTLLSWLGGTAATMFLSQMMPEKTLDQQLGHKFWKRYCDTHEAILAEKFEWDKPLEKVQ